MDGFYFFLGAAVAVLMVAAPFLVMIAVAAAIGLGLVALIRAVRTADHKRAAIGALILLVGATSGLMLLVWSTTAPAKGDTSSPHAYVHHSWQQTLLRFRVLTWMADGTFERLAKEQRQDRQGR